MVKNLEGGTSHPFDAMLAARFVNTNAQTTYTLGADSNNDGTMDAVAFTVDAMGPPAGSQIDAGATGSAVLDALVGEAMDAAITRVMGTWRGIRGAYTCAAGDCPITRTTGGATPYTLGAGMWQFTPAAGAMVTVPDQDWMVYGAWMTTPDNAAGTHLIGTLFNGFDTYAGANNVFAANDPNGLHGTATYSGGAAGIYVDGTASGLFTAEANLTANFDVNANGSADTTANDYTIAGRIDNFRGTDGVFLGSDTAANPNDPVAGGENDWVVMLGRVDLTAIPNGTIGATATTGSADGVPWNGMWNGQLFGPGDTAMNATAPSGVAGQFRAATGGTPAGTTAVVGAFGADVD